MRSILNYNDYCNAKNVYKSAIVKKKRTLDTILGVGVIRLILRHYAYFHNNQNTNTILVYQLVLCVEC